MRPSSAQLGEVLRDGFAFRVFLDALYDDNRLVESLSVDDCTLSWDIEGEISATGTLNVVYSGDFADSMTPRQFSDGLAPFGQEINLLIEVSDGGQFSETLLLGRYRIIAVDGAEDTYTKRLGRQIVVGSVMRLTIQDLFITVKRHGLRWPSPPVRTDSTYAEIQRLAGLPVLETLPDAETPTGIIYEPKEGGRLEAVQMLASSLGGVAYVTPEGEVSIIPFEPGAVVNTLAMGEGGRILSWPTSINSEGLYNEVVGSYQADDGTPYYGYAAITSGALATDGPFGPYTYADSAQGVQNQGQADKRAQAMLDQLTGRQTYRITVTCVLDPRIELGDVVELLGPLNDDGTPVYSVTGRVLSYGFGRGGDMTVTLEVGTDVSA